MLFGFFNNPKIKWWIYIPQQLSSQIKEPTELVWPNERRLVYGVGLLRPRGKWAKRDPFLLPFKWKHVKSEKKQVRSEISFTVLHINRWHIWADVCFVFMSNKFIFLVKYVATSALYQFHFLSFFLNCDSGLFFVDTYQSKVCFSSLISWLWQRWKHIL